MDDCDIAEEFAHRFASVFTTTNDSYIPTLSQSSRLLQEITNIEFTELNVSEAIKSLKTDSSPGPDSVPTVFLQKCCHALAQPLACLFNDLLISGKFPDTWSLSFVTPLHKKGDRQLAGNYRPISLTSCICKCMEKVIIRTLTPYLMEKDVLPSTQHGFLPGRSTITNMTSCLSDWTAAFDRNQQTDVIYLDFEKAFDKVPHQMLLYKLNHYGIRGNLFKLISNFLTRRYFQVRINGSLSTKHKVTSGVPQGSVLGPLLFLLYISDLARGIKTNIIFFADDTKLYANPETSYVNLQHDLRLVESWAKQWRMKLNEDKCTVLSIGMNCTHKTYTLNELSLRHVEQQEDLGITVTGNLKWYVHISKITKKANSLLYFIQRAFQDRSIDLILKIYKSYIRPKIEYGQIIWSPYFQKDIDLIEKIQRKVTKMPHELKDLEYEDRLAMLNLTTLKQRRLRGDLIETYKILNCFYTCPLNIYHPCQTPQLRGHSRRLEKERSSKLQRKNFLTNRIVYPWNSLSEESVSVPTLNSFKNKIDQEMNTLSSVHLHYGQ